MVSPTPRLRSVEITVCFHSHIKHIHGFILAPILDLLAIFKIKPKVIWWLWVWEPEPPRIRVDLSGTKKLRTRLQACFRAAHPKELNLAYSKCSVRTWCADCFCWWQCWRGVCVMLHWRQQCVSHVCRLSMYGGYGDPAILAVVLIFMAKSAPKHSSEYKHAGLIALSIQPEAVWILSWCDGINSLQ